MVVTKAANATIMVLNFPLEIFDMKQTKQYLSLRNISGVFHWLHEATPLKNPGPPYLKIIGMSSMWVTRLQKQKQGQQQKKQENLYLNEISLHHANILYVGYRVECLKRWTR